MSRRTWLGIGLAAALAGGVASAAAPNESTVAARLRALEQRVSELEAQASQSPSAELERRVSALEHKIGAAAPATAAAPSSLEQRVSKLEDKSAAPATAKMPAAPPRWQDAKNWTALRIGMTWSQVKQLLGVPGKVKAGVFGDVMYFPDDKGGSVEFDRDGRVSAWSRTGK